MDAFNELPPELQKIFIDTTREMNLSHMIPNTGSLKNQTIAAAKEKGVEFITLSESEVAIMRDAALGMWEEVETVNSNAAMLMKMLREYLDEKGVDYPGR